MQSEGQLHTLAACGEAVGFWAMCGVASESCVIHSRSFKAQWREELADFPAFLFTPGRPLADLGWSLRWD